MKEKISALMIYFFACSPETKNGKKAINFQQVVFAYSRLKEIDTEVA